MDSPHKPKPLSTHLFFLFLLLSTNLLTLFISSTFYSSCSLNHWPTAATTITAAIVAKSVLKDDIVVITDNSQITSDLPPEFVAFTSPQQLPFGFNTNFDSEKIIPPVGRPCTLFPDEFRRYMSYKVNGSCPDDELLAQKLLLKGCEPLPRRRCRSASQPEYMEPYPLPASFWSTPSDSSVVWTAYTCKNYQCLINRMRTQKGFDDCKDCFDLEGVEKTRWTGPKIGGGVDFSIDEVLAVKKPGTIRIGLDIGGGVATFALYISISQRLPFFDNTLDIVHSMHVLSNWIPTTLLHFLFFDIYRVLRPGGLFWLDHFFCVGEQLEEVYAPLINSIGFKKVKWVVGRKLDRGPELREMYLSALLEKPLKNSW